MMFLLVKACEPLRAVQKAHLIAIEDPKFYYLHVILGDYQNVFMVFKK